MDDNFDDIQEIYGEFIQESQALLASFNEHLVKLEKAPDDRDLLKKIFRIAHTIKGNTGFIGLAPVSETAHAMESILGRLRDGEMEFDSRINDAFFDALDFCGKLLADFRDDRLEEADSSAVVSRLNEILLWETGDDAPIPPFPGVAAEPAEEAPDDEIYYEGPDDTLRKASEAAVRQREGEELSRRKESETTYMRVKAKRLDKLVNLVGELAAGRSRLMQLRREIRSKSFEEVTAFINTIASELQEEILSLRMVPVKQLFNKFYRLVRDTARMSGKEVDLVVRGENTELDKTIIDEIYDPLVHLVRNAVSHGIEGPDERIRAGKDPKATLLLNAYHEQNNVFIEVTDDGRGLTIGEISEKAVAGGLVSGDELKSMSDREIAQFIFVPGFSTTRQVDEISGRGVGLDVVKVNVEKLGGMVHVDWAAGQGARFTMRLPLTLAILQIFLVKVNGQTYGIPLNYIEESVLIRREEMERMKGQTVFLLRHHPVVVVSLTEVFDIEGEEREEEILPVVILNIFSKKIGVIVEELLGKEETVVKPLGRYIDRLPEPLDGIAGASILGTGEVVLIVDVPTLFRSFRI